MLLPRWFLFTTLAIVAWGLWAVLSRLIGEPITAAQSQAMSTLGVIPVMVALAASRNRSPNGRSRRGAINGFIAGALTCAGNIAYYKVLNGGAKAATVVPLTAMYPLITVVLAVLFLRERLNRIQGVGILLSLAAIGLFNVSSVDGVINPWLAFALVPTALWGLSALMQKVSTNDVSGEASTFWFLAAFIPVGAAIFAFQPLTAPVPTKTWVAAAALGLFFSVGNYAVLLAFARDGKAAVIAPLAGLYPIVSVPIAILAFGEAITWREAAGIAAAVVSAAALAVESPSTPEPPAVNETHH